MNRFLRAFVPLPKSAAPRGESARRPALRLESLERRELMAGDVAAYVQNGNLFLAEAAGAAGQAQAVQISQLGNGKVRVQGTTADLGPSSLINGDTYQDFTVTGNLNVNFGGGDDLVVFSATATPRFNNAFIDVAAPAGFAGSDIDSVIAWSLATRGGLSVNTGAGEDWVFVKNMAIGDGLGPDNVTIHTGAGADQVDLTHGQLRGDVSIITYDAVSEADDDWVTVDNVGIAKQLTIQLGGGDDHATVSHASLKTLGIYGFDGADDVKLEKLYGIDGLAVSLGSGDDALAMDEIFAKWGVVSGGNGFDSLTVENEQTGGDAHYVGWETINGTPNFPSPWDVLGGYHVASRAPEVIHPAHRRVW
jgi:hypothetical protein